MRAPDQLHAGDGLARALAHPLDGQQADDRPAACPCGARRRARAEKSPGTLSPARASEASRKRPDETGERAGPASAGATRALATEKPLGVTFGGFESETVAPSTDPDATPAGAVVAARSGVTAGERPGTLRYVDPCDDPYPFFWAPPETRVRVALALLIAAFVAATGVVLFQAWGAAHRGELVTLPLRGSLAHD